MKKKVHAFGMAVVMLLLAVLSPMTGITQARADGGPVIKLHYNRPDGDYGPWSVWMWEEGGEGNDYAFAEENGEMVATKEVSPGTTAVGFIVRTQEWEKDYADDQFIDISEMVSGTVHVYVESQVEGYTKEYGEDAVTGTKLKLASYNGDGTISVTMTGSIEGDLMSAFSVAGKEGEIAVTEVTEGDAFVYTLVLEKELDGAKSYSITYDGAENSIRMPIIYSTPEFEDAYTYEGDDLGATWTKEKTSFRVWAPTAEDMVVNLYEGGLFTDKDLIESIPMTKDVNGTWIAEKTGDLNGVYYTYGVTIDGSTQQACDPYARTTGVNGKRAMILDLESTNPEGWDADKNPHEGEGINDAIIYEAHIRDLTTSKDAGITNVGKFLGLTETGTKTKDNIATGLDHMKELGITHLHLLPIYDFGSVDETFQYEKLYNWGYDPVNYNVPEGSYATDPYHGDVRVAELKQMVKGLHDNDISVVMDVVYNHVYNGADFCMNKIVPGYFSRIGEDGSYSNGSGCGNDTASERTMVKKYIVDSVNYWADEYHIDGFRFDLVGLLDVDTINEIVTTVHEKHPDVIFYGEGWTMNTGVTKDGIIMATQQSAEKMPGFAFFNDTIRDGLKGSVFDSGTGYVSGSLDKESIITRCFLGNDTWCPDPSQTINYVSCHDNNTLYDRLRVSRNDASDEDIVKMNNLAAAIYMTAQGVPFMQAGEEMLRTKTNEDGSYNANTYNAGDKINAIDWASLSEEKYQKVYEYYKGLIAFRKEHKALRLATADEVAQYVTPVEGLDSKVLAFSIKGEMEGESADELFLVFNANDEAKTVTLPEGDWNVYVNGESAGCQALSTVSGGSLSVDAISSMVLVKEGTKAEAKDENASENNTGVSMEKSLSIILVIVALIALLAVACIIFVRKKK